MRRTSKIICSMSTATALALGALVVLAPAASAQGAEIPGTDCGTTKYRITFWPKGHKAVPSVGFPAFPAPHAEVYSGSGKKFPDAQQVAYIDKTTQKISSSPPCVASTWQPGAKGTLSKTTTKPTLLVCTFTSNPVLFGATVQQGGFAMGFYVANKPTAYIGFGPTTQLQYDPKQCKANKPPH